MQNVTKEMFILHEKLRGLKFIKAEKEVFKYLLKTTNSFLGKFDDMMTQVHILI